MSTPTGYELITLEADRLRDVWETDLWAFAHGEPLEEFLAIPGGPPWGRMYGVVPTATAPGELAAIAGTYRFESFQVPGGTVPMAGLTFVGVHPGHRRRGLAASLIAHHFADAGAHGEVVSGLLASEESIYRRFGYGRGVDMLRLSIPRGAKLRDLGCSPAAPEVRVGFETFDPDTHQTLTEQVLKAAGTVETLTRPGWTSRTNQQVLDMHWHDLPAFREGREPRRIAIASRQGVPCGYATFRRKASWTDDDVPEYRVFVGEVVACDQDAARALWEVLLDLDLTTMVEVTVAPDDPVLMWLDNRRITRPRLSDLLWIRLVDLPGALSARQYQTDLDVVIDVVDHQIPANGGRWRLQAAAFGGPARCERTDADWDLALDQRDLAAAYLGHTSLVALAAAGLVATRTPSALRLAAVAFGWPVAPGLDVEF